MKKRSTRAISTVLALLMVLCSFAPVFANDTEYSDDTCTHKWGSWTTVSAPTYIEEGVKTRTCSLCGETEDAAIARPFAKKKWVKVEGKSYYLDNKGNVAKGWYKIKPNKKKAKVRWCYFNDNGVFTKSIKKNTKNKWVTAGGDKFYFTKKKKPLGKGFHMIKGKLYFMDYKGAMVKGTFLYDGQEYKTTKKGNIVGLTFYKYKYKTFVYIDISDQTLQFYKNGKQKLKTKVITGKPNKSTKTPTGIFKVVSKNTKVSLVGPSWSVKVDYWIAFKGSEYGMHDASWRSAKEFKNSKTYISNGLHGCVNMKYKDAKYLYKRVKKGTAVIIQD